VKASKKAVSIGIWRRFEGEWRLDGQRVTKYA